MELHYICPASLPHAERAENQLLTAQALPTTTTVQKHQLVDSIAPACSAVQQPLLENFDLQGFAIDNRFGNGN